jgi:protein-tyrosine phosphatase
MHSPIKTVVYIHCSQGIDRVGYIAAAYKMKNLGYTFTDAMVENFQLTKTVREHMHFNSFKALQWYCLHLGKS